MPRMAEYSQILNCPRYGDKEKKYHQSYRHVYEELQ